MKCQHSEDYPISTLLLSSEFLFTAFRAAWVVDEGEGPWLGRSLLAMHLEQFADRSVRRLQRLFFAEAENCDLHQELSTNTAMLELESNGPLNRARRQLCQAKLGALASVCCHCCRRIR